MAGDKPKPPVAPVTVMFADITASTTLYAQRGDATAYAITRGCLDLIEAQIRSAGGRVVKHLGDGMLAVFDSPAAAISAAVQIRVAVADPASGMAGEGVQVRCGIASGSAVLAADDVYGDTVNVASRLMSLAGADEIFLSGKVYEALPSELRTQVRVFDQVALRNRPTPVLVYELVREEHDLTVSAPVRARASTAVLEITHAQALFVIGPERPHLTIGRHSSCDIRLDHDMVSRTHAEIALRRDKFALIDRSTNGTYVYIDEGPMLRVAREEIILGGAGRIVPGVESGAAIRYRVAAL
jgi:class 3 adenylate cyclase